MKIEVISKSQVTTRSTNLQIDGVRYRAVETINSAGEIIDLDLCDKYDNLVDDDDLINAVKDHLEIEAVYTKH